MTRNKVNPTPLFSLGRVNPNGSVNQSPDGKTPLRESCPFWTSEIE